MQKAQLDASKSRMMNEKGVVKDGKRISRCHEIGGKVGKNTDPKTCNGNNLAKLNDAKSTIYACDSTVWIIEKHVSVGVFAGFNA